ncbi:SIR2 family protein [Companilactobacillus mishanensis]|nr:SIR2 family protein [Companilactobacillus mishanensis]
MDSEKSELDLLKRTLPNKRLNFLIGSGASKPVMPLMDEIDGDDLDEKNEKLKQKIIELSKQSIVFNYHDQTKDNYVNFIKSLVNIMNHNNSRTSPKSINIFSTNYDLYVESAVDFVMGQGFNFVFNDGGSGYFRRLLKISNYDRSISYKGQFNNYINDAPMINLFKPHGSVNWIKKSNQIVINNDVEDNPFVILPNGRESENTYYDNHFYEILRTFQVGLEINQSVLITIGFSFGDEYILKMVKRALYNPGLLVYVFCYNVQDCTKIKERFVNKGVLPNNLKIIYPRDEGSKDGFDITNLTELLNGVFSDS